MNHTVFDRATLMAELYKSGRTQDEVAAQFGVTRQRVQQLIAKLGVGKADGGKRERSRRRLQVMGTKPAYGHGCSVTEMWTIPKAARRPYIQHRTNARKRGILWEFTLPTWWAVWAASGKFAERRRGGFGMARHGDAGPYAPWNVYICPNSQNIKDYHALRRGRPAAQPGVA